MSARPIGKIDGRWLVNGNAIPEPHEVHIEHTNVAGEDTGRAENGVMKITWIRRDVRRVSMKWHALTGAEVAHIIGLMQGNEYEFIYWDAGSKSFHGYTGDNDYSIYSYSPKIYGDEENKGLYTDLSIDAVEL